MLTGGSSPDLLCNVLGQSVGEKPEGTRASSHSFGYICSALRREGLAADKVILKASTFLGGSIHRCAVRTYAWHDAGCPCTGQMADRVYGIANSSLGTCRPMRLRA